MSQTVTLLQSSYLLYVINYAEVFAFKENNWTHNLSND